MISDEKYFSFSEEKLPFLPFFDLAPVPYQPFFICTCTITSYCCLHVAIHVLLYGFGDLHLFLLLSGDGMPVT